MQDEVDLYDSHYSGVEEDVSVAIRRETFGEDLGQASWITASEAERFIELLGIAADDRVLEVVHRLAEEGRLSRHTFLARRP